VLEATINGVCGKYRAIGYDVQSLHVANYGKTSFLILSQDIVKKNIKWTGKLLLIVRDPSLNTGTQKNSSLHSLNQLSAAEAAQINGNLRSMNCKILYIPASSAYSGDHFKHFHIDFLPHILHWYGRYESLDMILTLKKENKIPSGDIELHDTLLDVIHEDNLSEALLSHKISQSQFLNLINKRGIYPFVLFIGTFLRGLEFDEFEQILFLLIDEIASEKEAKKLVTKWKSKADIILQKAGLNDFNSTNYRLVDFQRESDAELCQAALMTNARIGVDKMANHIVSPEFYFFQSFRETTMLKINAFIVSFGNYSARYYKSEVPLALFKFATSKEARFQELDEEKRVAQSNFDKISTKLANCEEVLRVSRKLSNYKDLLFKRVTPEFEKLMHEFNHLKYLVLPGSELPSDLDIHELIDELKQAKRRAWHILNQRKEEWKPLFFFRKSAIRRLGTLLIELESENNSAQEVDLLIDDSFSYPYAVSFVFDLLIELQNRNEKRVFQWYLKQFTANTSKEEVFKRLLNLLYYNETNLFKLIEEIKECTDLEDKYSDISSPQTLTILAIITCLNLSLPNPKVVKIQEKEKIMTWSTATSKILNENHFSQGIFNANDDIIKEELPWLIRLLFEFPFEKAWDTEFPDNKFLDERNYYRFLTELFYFWHATLLISKNEEKRGMVMIQLRNQCTTPHIHRLMLRASKSWKSNYNQLIIKAENHEERSFFKKERESFNEFIKSIL